MLDRYVQGHSTIHPTAAVVLAAGEGTRMRSATAKVLHPIAGRSLLGHAVRAVAALEPEHLVVVLGHQKEQVSGVLTELGEELARPVLPAEQPQRLGTGHAVECGLTGPVVVTYGDVPLLEPATLTAMLTEHAGSGAAVTVLTAEVDDPTGYGRMLRDEAGRVTGIVEQRDATEAQRAVREINSGLYVFDAEFLTAGLARLGTDNSQGERYLTDLVAVAHADGRPVLGLVCADTWQVRGVNDRVQLAEVRGELNRRILDRWMRDGVTVVDPGSTWIDADVRLAPDVLLQPGTQLLGRTAVHGGAEIGPDTTLDGCEIGAGATVVRTHGSRAFIGPGASVGPFAYLRPGTRLGERGKIGTFVEVKNSDIGADSKVPHLTYVGDADIGEHSNIGASSVFVNYDGVQKHRSVVGSHVRAGSDNMFVAPVRIGDGAYTGAGTVLRQDVPPGALAVSAGEQRIIEGWVERKRPGTPAAEAARRASARIDPANIGHGGTQR